MQENSMLDNELPITPSLQPFVTISPPETLQNTVFPAVEKPKGITGTEAKVKFLHDVVIGIVVVIGLSFVLLVIQYFTATQTAFINLGNQVTAQNAKIDILIELQQKANGGNSHPTKGMSLNFN